MTNSRVLAAGLTVTRTILTTMTGSFGLDHTNQVAVTASPLLTNNEVYDAYLEFLSVPGSLVVSCDPPPPCAAQISRKYEGSYYWVPVESRKEFFKLSLATTAQRGKRLFAPTDYYPVTLQKVLGQVPGPFVEAPWLIVQLDTKVPAASGFVVLNKGGVEAQYVTRPRDQDDKPLSESDIILLAFNPAAGGPKDIASFTGKLPLSSKLYLRYHQPKPPTTDQLLERTNFQLQQIQFNQLRESSAGL